MQTHRNNLTDRQRKPALRAAAAATELAFVLPVLLLITFGCVDFGRVAYTGIVLSNAVGCGASCAATHQRTDITAVTWDADVRDAVIEEMDQLAGFDSAQLTVAASSNAQPDGSIRVTVEATYPFETVVDWPGLPSTVQLRKQVSARRFR